MRGAFLFCFLAIFVSGCAGVPFEEPSRVYMGEEDPWAVSRRFSEKIPKEFSLLNTIVFRYTSFRKISAIGTITANTNEREFTVACINPLGVKLFEISTARGEVEEQFALEEFTDRGDFARAVVEDIGRIYFDLVPSPEARAHIKKYKVVFKQNSSTGSLWHVFAGTDANLVQKRLYEDGKLSWKVSYYEYTDVDGKLFPAGIVLDNYKYGYRLVVKLKEVYGNEQD